MPDETLRLTSVKAPLTLEAITESLTKSLDSAHQSLRAHEQLLKLLQAQGADSRESLDTLLKLVNDHHMELSELRNRQRNDINRMDKIESILNDNHRIMHDLRASLQGVDREQQMIMVQAMKTEVSVRDLGENVVRHMRDETTQFETYHKRLIRFTYVLMTVIILAHGVAFISSDSPIYEQAIKLLELTIGK